MPFNLQKFIKHLEWTSVTDITRHDKKHKRNRYHNYLLAISLIGNPVFANTSNTAAPVAQSSSSVSNFATQVLGGPMVMKIRYGNGIVCSGPQMGISPFVTTTCNQIGHRTIFTILLFTTTQMQIYDDVPDNPGNILYYQENYSGNKDSLGLNFGFHLLLIFH